MTGHLISLIEQRDAARDLAATYEAQLAQVREMAAWWAAEAQFDVEMHHRERQPYRARVAAGRRDTWVALAQIVASDAEKETS